AACALDGLEEERADAGPLAGHARQRLGIVERYPHEAGNQGLEALVHLRVAGRREGGEGASMEGVLVDDDLGRLDAAAMAVEAGELDRRLVGLQARVAEEDVL